MFLRTLWWRENEQGQVPDVEMLHRIGFTDEWRARNRGRKRLMSMFLM